MPASIRFLYIIIAPILLWGCGQKPAPSAVNTSSHALNDDARELAGMGIDTAAYYSSYRDSMDRAFQSMDTGRSSHIRNWSREELPQDSTTVFYPFSGPDILNCIHLFPNANEYVLMALEGYGSLPHWASMDTTSRERSLSYVYRSLGDLFGKGYFVTRSMLTEVSNAYNGVLPIACVSLVRSGYDILDIKYKHLEDDGELKEIAQDSLNRGTNNCVEIYFRKRGKDKIQKLSYFKTNLADNPYEGPDYFKLNTSYNPNHIQGLKENQPLRDYIQRLPKCIGLIKSASYLMHQGHFELIRGLVENRCRLILQDDTGIPFSYFVREHWRVKLYGAYAPPISIFHGGYFQKDLDSAYHAGAGRISHLPFSFGYHCEDSVQNLMKMEKP